MKFSRLFSLAFLVVGLSLWTLAPYGGCSCNNPLGPDSGPPPTPTPDHGPKVDDMEHPGSPNDNFGGPIQVSFDNFQPGVDPAPGTPLSHNSTMNAANTVITSGGSTLLGGTPGYGAHAYGYIGHDSGSAPYPYAQLMFLLGNTANVPFYAPNKRLKFSFKTNSCSPCTSFFVNFTDTVIQDYGWYRYQFTPANSNWNSYTVYFPDGASLPKFAQGFGTCKRWSSTSAPACSPAPYVVDSINAVVFQPVPPTGAAQRYAYDFLVDDITFE